MYTPPHSQPASAPQRPYSSRPEPFRSVYGDHLERDMWFVLGLVLAGLVVVAFLANGEGAGSAHHQFVRLVLAGLFVAGSGILGLVVMNAACGYIRLDEAHPESRPTFKPVSTTTRSAAPDTTEPDPHLERQAEHYRRRVYRESQPTEQPAPTTATARPAQRPAPRNTSPPVSQPTAPVVTTAPQVQTSVPQSVPPTASTAGSRPAPRSAPPLPPAGVPVAPIIPPTPVITQAAPTVTPSASVNATEYETDDSDETPASGPGNPTRMPLRRRRPRR